ncbi:HBL/NHE enterotoxin family protein [Bacillus mycoides]|uniref:HBL/NHE enterotoxin family protein n=1 Tax=Bacillus mycoides TaxID=1405 RepID=UPI002112739A|nr:HBL/NHE enterotoxin family protein [Bacillus mycoides]MCQ6530703.1 alpha-helical pore-forming toxin family protein [Bacillus mycoides]
MTCIPKVRVYVFAVICTICVLFTSRPVFAEAGIPTIMDGLTQRIIDLHPTFADRMARARNTNLNANVLTSTTAHEASIYEQAIQWKNGINPRMKTLQNQVLSYNTIFQSTYSNIKKQIQAKNKEQLLKLLEDMQSNMIGKKQNVTEFLTTLRDFKKNSAINSQKLQTDANKIQVAMEGYRTTLDSLYEQLYTTTSDSVREQLENQTLELSESYEYLDILYNQIHTIIDSLNGVNDGVLNVGWLISLYDMNTKWITVESKLQHLIQNVKEASDLNWSFITADINTVKENWDDVYNKTKEL